MRWGESSQQMVPEQLGNHKEKNELQPYLIQKLTGIMNIYVKAKSIKFLEKNKI